MVVNHLVGNTRLLSSGVTPGTEEYKWKLLRLLWVCQNFRTVAAARFYRVNSQNIGDDYSDDKTNQDWSSRRLQKYYQSLHPQTREVHLLLSKSSVYFGQALESLSSAPFDSWNFQEIRKLKLQFYVPQWQQNEWDEQYAERASMLKRASTMSEYYDWLDEKRREIEEEDLKITPTVKANINEFVFWVKRMMPTLCEIEVEYGLVELEQDPGNDFFDTLLEPLLRLAPRMALLSIAPNAAVRRFPCGESQPDILSLISIFSNYPNIQVLDLSDIFLPFWDTITLIKSIPLLSDLHIMTPYIIQLPANVKDKELPAYMLSNFTPMGQRFRCWHISKASGPIITSVRCVLLLALICPNFDYCVPPKDEFREYMDEFKIVINSGGFKDHAHRLQRFLLSN
ncbi:hypothetical protein H4S03_008352 [Coemansia sp. S3946]|nr:hypothetical protein H4S03_008352 [Coemansia sp. S3946]